MKSKRLSNLIPSRQIHIALGIALTLLLATGCGTDQPIQDSNPRPGTDSGLGADTGLSDVHDRDGFDVERDAFDDIDDDADQGPHPTLVVTTEGPVSGVIDERNRIWKYLGIPYAAPPTGELRWQPTEPPQVRSQTLEATEFGPACPQNREILVGTALTWDEDCLSLNIWRPALVEAPLPVMVWIHGGAFISGGTNQHIGGKYLYEGTTLTREGVIVVTLNYRLGALGFLAHEAFDRANFGLLDQLAALHWIQDNIAAFGGDPNRVTVFGESAGAVSICTLMTTNRAQGLFHRAILQSGYCPDQLPTLSRAHQQGARLERAVGCHNAVDKAYCLRSKSPDEILAAIDAPIDGIFNDEAFRPVLDGVLLSQNPAFVMGTGNAMDIPIIMGANADEGTVFMRPRSNLTDQGYVDLLEAAFGEMADEVLEAYPADAYEFPWLAASDIIGDLVFVCPTRWAVEAHTRHGREAYHYHFTHVTVTGELFRIGAFHGSDIPFVFDTFGVYSPTIEEVEIGEQMRAFWLNFARGQAPGTVDGLSWPPFTLTDDEGLEFAAPSTVVSGWRADRCQFWRTVLGLD
jgi:para-nitrobenzyl esterase